jgi:hypothetical protein
MVRDRDGAVLHHAKDNSVDTEAKCVCCGRGGERNAWHRLVLMWRRHGSRQWEVSACATPGPENPE